MHIAVFGGSFDPPHIGHEAIVQEACQQLDIDKLFVVPTFLNPFKSSSHIDAAQRLTLIKKLFSMNQKVEICEYEVNQKRAVQTVETIEYLSKKFNPSKIYLIVGADNFKSIETWNHYDKLEQMVEFVVAKRDCTQQDFKGIKQLDIHIQISSTQLRHSLNIDYIPQTIQEDVKTIWQNKR